MNWVSDFHHLPSTDPTFVHAHLIPDSAEKNDDKLYFFFREKASEMGQSPMTQSRIGRICLVSEPHVHHHQWKVYVSVDDDVYSLSPVTQ